jgi:hypothetical protein
VPNELVNRDILYFDLQNEVGDTVRYPDTGLISEGIIIGIDTIELGGITRYRWEIEIITGVSQIEYFVTGIGNSKGLFNFLGEIVNDGFIQANTCYTDINNQSFFAQEMYTENFIGILNTCFLVTGGSEEISNKIVSVFPNPGSGNFTLKREKAGEARILIRDLSGRILITREISATIENIPVEMLNAGIYLIEVLETNGTGSRIRWINQ